MKKKPTLKQIKWVLQYLDEELLIENDSTFEEVIEYVNSIKQIKEGGFIVRWELQRLKKSKLFKDIVPVAGKTCVNMIVPNTETSATI